MKPLYVKKNGVVYRVSGTGIPSIYPAANVEYDNTVTSELQATDVQDAIDELSTRQGGVQSDWDEDDTTELDYIKNKPQNLVQDASYVHTDNNYDATAKGTLLTSRRRTDSWIVTTRPSFLSTAFSASASCGIMIGTGLVEVLFLFVSLSTKPSGPFT